MAAIKLCVHGPDAISRYADAFSEGRVVRERSAERQAAGGADSKRCEAVVGRTGSGLVGDRLKIQDIFAGW